MKKQLLVLLRMALAYLEQHPYDVDVKRLIALADTWDERGANKRSHVLNELITLHPTVSTRDLAYAIERILQDK